MFDTTWMLRLSAMLGVDGDDRTAHEASTLAKVAQAYRAASASADDPYLGLRIAKTARISHYGLPGLLMANSRDVTAALSVVVDATAKASFGAVVELMRVGDVASVRLGFADPVPGVELMLQDLGLFFASWIRRSVKSPVGNVTLHLRQHSAGPSTEAGVAIAWGASADEVCFPASWLSEPVEGADPALLLVLQQARAGSEASEADVRRPTVLQLRGCTVDLAAGIVHRGKEVHHLTSRERDLLGYLARYPNQLVRQEELERSVWEINSSVVTHAPAVAIRRLRTKIEPHGARPVNLLTVFGEGWKLVVSS
jgi:DNA-binding response OmpR family regulator